MAMMTIMMRMVIIKRVFNIYAVPTIHLTIQELNNIRVISSTHSTTSYPIL